MKKLIFVTSGKIKYTFEGKTLFESIRLTAGGKRFPHLTEGSKGEIIKLAGRVKENKPAVIFSAISFQCVETANIISGKLDIPVVQNKDLLPLRFSLDDFFSEKEFKELKDRQFVEIRKAFVSRFFDDKLLDNRLDVKRRYERIVSEARKYDGNILLVSHAYLIRLFSIYYKVGDRIYKDKDLLVKMFNPGVEPMKRLEVEIFEV